MINDKIFSDGFVFITFNYKKYKRTDNRVGAKKHYIAYMLRGRAKIVSENNRIDVCEGDIFYIPKGLGYESFWYGSPTVEFASLGFEFMPSGEHFALQSISRDMELGERIAGLARDSFVDAERIGTLYTILGELVPKMQVTNADKKSELVLRVKRYISQNPKESVASVAKHFAVSESGLYSIFKKHSALSISECKNQALMNSAREMLISTDVSIEDISQNLGFSSSSYFRKRFKAHFGISPREMRRKSGI